MLRYVRHLLPCLLISCGAPSYRGAPIRSTAAPPVVLAADSSSSRHEPTAGMLSSVISIRGNHLDEIGLALTSCGYVIERRFTVSAGPQASRELAWLPDRNHVAKVAYVASGWTYLVDPELVLVSDEVWLEYSKRWNTRVVAWMYEDTSASLGLTVFESGQKRREVLAVEGELSVNAGDRFPEEAGLDWTQASEADVVETAKRLGAVYDYLGADREYVVFRLDETRM